MGVVVTKKSNMASYFPEAGNLNSSNTDMCPDVAGPSSSGSGDLFEVSYRLFHLDLALDPVLLLFPTLLALLAAILDLNLTTTPILPFKACNVIMYKVYSSFSITLKTCQLLSTGKPYICI